MKNKKQKRKKCLFRLPAVLDHKGSPVAGYLHEVKPKPRFYVISRSPALICFVSNLLTLFTKINVWIKGPAKSRIVYDTVLLNKG